MQANPTQIRNDTDRTNRTLEIALVVLSESAAQECCRFTDVLDCRIDAAEGSQKPTPQSYIALVDERSMRSVLYRLGQVTFVITTYNVVRRQRWFHQASPV